MWHCLESSDWCVPSSWGHHFAAGERVADVLLAMTILVDEETKYESEEIARVSEQPSFDYEAEFADSTEQPQSANVQ